jgi:3-oxoadipate enol-lactonase
MQSSGQHLNIRVDNLNICYEDHGQGDVPVIFIHGFPFDKTSWHPQLDYLKDFYRVIAYDIRGFCKSTSEDMKASMDLFAQDLISLMDVLNIRQSIICGLSMGGYIALNAVRHYPERFRALVLCDTQSIADSAEGKEKRYKTIEEVEKNGLDDFAATFIQKIFSPDTLENNEEAVEGIRKTILSTPVATIARTLSALAQRLETTSILQEIKIPTLILCGEQDSVTPPAQSENMHRHIIGSEYQAIRNAGHLSNLEQPEEFNRLLKNFLDRVV